MDLNIRYVTDSTSKPNSRPTSSSPSSPTGDNYTPPFPQKGDYNSVRKYVEERKKYDSVRQFCKPGTTPRQIIDAWMAMLGELPQQRLDFLASLKQQGYPLFLLSNGNELHFNYINDTYHLDRYFDELFLSQRLHMAKPDPDIFIHVHRAICQRYMPLATHPDSTPHVIFIDDLPANRQSATDTVHWTSVSALTDLCRFVPISGNDSI